MQHLKQFNFNDEDLLKFEAIAHIKAYQPEDLIIKKGEKDRSLLIIRKGKVKVLVDHDDKAKIVAKLTEGDIIGELNFTIPLHRSANVVAMDNTEVLSFHYHDLCSLLDSEAKLAEKFFHGINVLLISKIHGMLK
jgi:CRP-like cAMP-binding protein